MAPGCADLLGLLVCRGEMGVNTVVEPRLGLVFDPAVAPGGLPAKVRVVAATHGHADHIRFAAAYRDAGAVVYVPRHCVALAENPGINYMATMGWAGPVEEEYITRYFVGGGVRVDYPVEPGMLLPGVSALPAPGHTPGSMVYLVEAPRGRVLVAGDTVYGRDYLGATPVLYHTDAVAWLSTLRGLLDVGFDALVPGHGEPAVGKEARRLLEENIAKVEEMMMLVYRLLPPGRWVYGDEAAALVARETGYARSRRAYSILGPTVRALLRALARRGLLAEAMVEGVPAWKKK